MIEHDSLRERLRSIARMRARTGANAAQVMVELGAPYASAELASFMSVSKGYMGECGLRGGWMELLNMQPAVQANLYKCISAMLCPTVLGQAAVDCVVSALRCRRSMRTRTVKSFIRTEITETSSVHGFAINPDLATV